MSKKTITLTALIFCVIGLVLSILNVTVGFEPDIKIGYDEEFVGSSILWLNSTFAGVSIAVDVIFSIFVIAYLWGIKKAGNAIIGNIAIFFWLVWVLIVAFSWVINISAIINGEGESLYRSLDYWQSEGASKYPLLWFYLGNLCFTYSYYIIISGLLAHLLFIPSFISTIKQNKAVGIFGIVTMVLYITVILRYFQAVFSIPYIFLLERISWIVLLALSLRWYSQRS